MADHLSGGEACTDWQQSRINNHQDGRCADHLLLLKRACKGLEVLWFPLRGRPLKDWKSYTGKYKFAKPAVKMGGNHDLPVVTSDNGASISKVGETAKGIAAETIDGEASADTGVKVEGSALSNEPKDTEAKKGDETDAPTANSESCNGTAESSKIKVDEKTCREVSSNKHIEGRISNGPTVNKACGGSIAAADGTEVPSFGL